MPRQTDEIEPDLTSTRISVRANVQDLGIATLEDLREHLQWAIELEHSTLPSYLCALYTIDCYENAPAHDAIHSVFLEEMLHMAMAANLLNAVGGRPEIDTRRMLPGYPRRLPHGDPSVVVSLLPFGTEALELFMRVELPSAADAPAQGDRYETIGQFYEAIKQGLIDLCDRLGHTELFCGDPARQLADSEFRGGPGRIFKIGDLDTALAAIDVIVSQGEGARHVEVWDGDCDMFDSERYAVGHYYRFKEIEHGRRYRRGDTPATGPTGEVIGVDWQAVRPVRRDQRSVDQPPGSAARTAQDEFNSAYCGVLQLLERAFDGHPEALGAAIPAMFGLRMRAVTLMEMPIGDGTEVAGPTFEYVEPDDRR